jgi:thymidylate kinase
VSQSVKPLIVEFFGTPGAGKTTLLKATQTIFQERGFRAYSVVEAARPFSQRTLLGQAVNRLSPAQYRKQLLWQVFYYTSLVYRLKFMREHMQLSKYVASSQKRRPAAAAIGERRVLYWFHHLMGYHEFLRAHAQPGEVLIWDDGFVHRAVHLHASTVETPDLADIRTYVDLIPQPDIVIVPCTPIEVCEERIMQRGIWKHFQNKNRVELKQYLASADRVVKGTLDYIKSRGWLVVEVDNSGTDLALTNAELQKKLMNTTPLLANNLKL